MNCRSGAFFLLAVIAMSAGSAAVASAESDTPMPRAIFTIHPPHPHYLQDDQLFDASGHIRRDASLSSMAQRSLTDFLNLPRVNGCIPVGEVYLDYVNAPIRKGLAGAMATADFIIEAKVIKRSSGFMEGVPGQLLRLGDVSTLKGDAANRTLPYYYIFVPVADFTVGGLHFCKTDRRFGAAPEVGDTVFVFAAAAFVTNDYINIIDERGYARALPDGRVLLSKSQRNPDGAIVTASDIRCAAREAAPHRQEAP